MSDPEKQAIADPVPIRSVAFPELQEPDHGIEERPPPRTRGAALEMRRELTKEERELAQAGYDHLEPTRTHSIDGSLSVTGQGEKDAELNKVDIQEHAFRLADLEKALDTSIVVKDPAASHGLEEKEASLRLQRDGRNILTPPKKKSALRKVGAVV